MKLVWQIPWPRDNFPLKVILVICIKNFAEGFVVRTDTAICPDGSVSVPRKIPKLTRNVISIYFHNCHQNNFPWREKTLSRPGMVSDYDWTWLHCYRGFTTTLKHILESSLSTIKVKIKWQTLQLNSLSIHSFCTFLKRLFKSTTTQRCSRLQHWYYVRVNTPKRYRQLWAKDLPKVPTWLLEQD